MDVNQRLESILGQSGDLGVAVGVKVKRALKWMLSHSLLVIFALIFGLGCFVTGLFSGKRKY